MQNSTSLMAKTAWVILALCFGVVFSTTPTIAAKQKININTATSKELQTLPQIGPKTAKAIIKYRAKHPFKKVDELLEVKGIGKKTLKKLKPLVTVGKGTKKKNEKSKKKSNKKATKPKSTQTKKKK